MVLAFAIPIEHKYDKLFRFYSLSLIPEGLKISQSYEKKIYFYISDLIAITLFLMGIFWFRIPFKRLFGNPLWIVFLCAIISIIASPFFNYPIPYIRLLQLFTPIALFSFISTAFSDEERIKVVRYIGIAIVAAGLFQSAIAITQYFHQAPLGLRILGETTQIGTFVIESGSRWLLDDLLNYKGEPTIMRAAGTLPHTNVFGGFMVLSLLTTYAFLIQTEKRRWLLSLLLFLQFFAMSLSYSRASLFAWAISTFIWFGLMVYHYGFKNKRLQHIALVIAVSLGLTATLLHKQYFYRGGVINYNSLARDSDNIRKFHQRRAIYILKDHPLFGLGFSQFSEGASPYFPKATDAYTRATAPHNIFLFLACETGLISLIAFLFFIATLFNSFLRSFMTLETITFTSLLIGFIFIGCCDFYPILFQQGKLMFFLTAALIALSVKKRVFNSILVKEI